MEFGWALATIAVVGVIVALIGIIGGRILLKQAERGPDNVRIQLSHSERQPAREVGPGRAAAFDGVAD